MTLSRWHNNPGYYAWTQRRKEQEGNCSFAPSANVIDNDEAFKLELAAPGFTKKDFKIDLEKDILTITSEREEKNELNYTRREFGDGNFCRSFVIPETVETEKIKAEYKNGVLALTLPKKEVVKIKKEIQIA